MEPWEGVVDIPEGEVGEHKIEHFTRPAGEVERSNLRTAAMGGQADEPLVFDRETKWHRLSYSGGTWMTDLPIEQTQHDQELEPIDSGSVLIGGLGVGYAANVLAAREDIERIVVVEISSEVIQLVQPHLKDPEGKIEVVNADLFDYLRGLGEEDWFDWGFYDIWQTDSEATFFGTVCPLRDLSEHVDEVICWNENVMRGQLFSSLRNRWWQRGCASQIPDPAEIDGLPDEKRAGLERLATAWGKLDVSDEERATPRENIWWDWQVPFWEMVVAGEVTDENFDGAAGAYAARYGLPCFTNHGRAQELWDAADKRKAREEHEQLVEALGYDPEYLVALTGDDSTMEDWT